MENESKQLKDSMEGEMNIHIENSRPSWLSENWSNMVKTSFGNVEIGIPRDRDSS